MLGAQLVVGIIAAIASALGQILVVAVFGPVEGLTFGVSLVISVAIGWPFVYVPAGIILGEVGVWEAIRRSMGLVRLRKRLAVVVTLFGVLSQFIVLFGLSIGVDMVSRVLVGTGLTEDFRGRSWCRSRRCSCSRPGPSRSSSRPSRLPRQCTRSRP